MEHAALRKKPVDPSGTWRWEHQSLTTQETVKDVLKIKVDDGKVSGTYKGEGEPVEIQDAKIDGDTLSFQFDVFFQADAP